MRATSRRHERPVYTTLRAAHEVNLISTHEMGNHGGLGIVERAKVELIYIAVEDAAGAFRFAGKQFTSF